MSGAATIRQCLNEGSITSTGSAVGGIAGNTGSGSALTECGNTGSVKGTFNVGGLVGASQSDITDCYNTGSVTATAGRATQGVGGLVGTQSGAADKSIRNSYNAGAVGCTVETPVIQIGAVIGYINANNLTLDNVHYLNTSADNAVGLARTGYTVNGEAIANTEEELTAASMVSTLNGESGSVWAKDSVPLNGGYPILSWKEDEAEATMVFFQSHSLLLSGKIGVNFFMNLPGDASEYADSYMTFTVNSETQTAAFDPDNMNATGQFYGFTCYVDSVSMADDITAVFHYGDETVENTYSVAQYIDEFEKVKNLFDEKTVTLIESLADYGHYMQLFLSETKYWTIGKDHQAMSGFTESYDIAAVKEAVEKFAIVRESDPDIASTTYSLLLDAETTIYVYLKPADGYTGDIAVSVNGTAAEAELLADGRYRVAVPNIAAHKLGDTYTIQAVTANGTAKVEVSAMSYAQGLLNAAAYAENTNAQNAMAALYKYYEAAAAMKQA